MFRDRLMETELNFPGRCSKGKCVRLCAIFVVSGLLCVTSLGRVFTRSSTTAHLLEMMMMVLTVLLVCCVVETCCKPLDDVPQSRASVGSRGSHSYTRDPLVYAESPPSYEEVLAAEALEPPSSTSQEDQAAGKTIPGTLQHSPTPKPFVLQDTAVFGSYQHSSVPRRYSPFIPESTYSYSVSSEIQLSVDELPSYEEAVTVLQSGASAQHQVNTNHDMNLMFI
ncbi:uncharacterized protein [Procambarus clarkii]|uniref:uncharacterized protein isoform X1 n=1 Tax=Procambarus clarkii TaxID=6728 RepID=UPI0037421322